MRTDPMRSHLLQLCLTLNVQIQSDGLRGTLMTEKRLIDRPYVCTPGRIIPGRQCRDIGPTRANAAQLAPTQGSGSSRKKAMEGTMFEDVRGTCLMAMSPPIY